MKFVYGAVLSLFAGIVQATEKTPALNVPAGTAVICLPFPSTETLDKTTVFKGGKPMMPRGVTCTVTDGQLLPDQSKFVGRQIAGPAANSYVLTWDSLQLPDGHSVRSDIIRSMILSTTPAEVGYLRVTFEKAFDTSLYNQ